MTAVRNAKGQFVKKAAVTVDPVTEMKDLIVAKVKDFAEEIYGKVTQKSVLKAYRKLFDADYQTSYAWLNASGLAF